MTILQAIQEATTEAGFKGLSYGTLTETNSKQDTFGFNDWPRNLVVPFSIRGTFTGIRAQETLNLRGWVLKRIPEDTNDWRSPQLEIDHLSPCRDLARKFIRNLLNKGIIDPEREQAQYSIDPEIMFLNSHLFGVIYTAQIPIMKNVC